MYAPSHVTIEFSGFPTGKHFLFKFTMRFFVYIDISILWKAELIQYRLTWLTSDIITTW